MWKIRDTETHRYWTRHVGAAEITTLEPLATAGPLPSDGHRQIRTTGDVLLTASTLDMQRDPDRVADALAQLLLETALHAAALLAPAPVAEVSVLHDLEDARRTVP